MNWIEPLSEDFLYCDPQHINSELYRVCTDEQVLQTKQSISERPGKQPDNKEGGGHD